MAVNSFEKIFHASYPHLIHHLLNAPFCPRNVQESFIDLSIHPYTRLVRSVDFDYSLPEGLIAQQPAAQREASRLLILNRKSNSITHARFPALIDHVQSGDVLILNDSRVFNARLRGVNRKSGGEFEVLLLTQNSLNDWWVMLRPGKRARIGTEIVFKTPSGEETKIIAEVLDKNDEGHRRVKFSGTSDILREADRLGEVPLPPYIRRSDTRNLSADVLRYQTVYAKAKGSVAAPTAGLHFTENFLERLRAKGVQIHYVTLHVGLGTFAPVKTEQIQNHIMHSEKFFVPDETAQAVNAARAQGRRVVAVGTTSVRVLETVAARQGSQIASGAGETNIFIYPPYRFRIVDALLTNFHLPHSTLLMLVSAFAAPGETRGRDLMLNAYSEAIREKYRFYSYGDAMLIL